MEANKRQLAEIFGISEETITQWVKAGCPVELQRRGAAGNVYETSKVLAWPVGRSDAVSGALDPAQERARLHEARRLRLEREARVAEGA